MTRWFGGLEWKFHEAAVNATQGSVYFFFSSAVPLSPSLPPCHPAARERRAIECGGGRVFDSCLPTLPQAVRGGGGFREERKANLGRGDNERHQTSRDPWVAASRTDYFQGSFFFFFFFLSFLQSGRGGEKNPGASHASASGGQAIVGIIKGHFNTRSVG